MQLAELYFSLIKYGFRLRPFTGKLIKSLILRDPNIEVRVTEKRFKWIIR